MSEAALHELSAAELGRGYAARSFSPVEVAQSVIAHAERCEPKLHALWAFEPESVLAMARESTARWQRGTARGALDGVPVTIKVNVDTALDTCPTVSSVVVVNRCDTDVTMVDGRDHWYHDLVGEASADCPPEHMDSEDLLYLLYTSGTTAKPKGIMHTTGGYLTQVAFSHHYVFDLKADTDVYWCAADCGWVTGHSYIVYGPLANGATSVMYEGTPDTPRPEFRNGPQASWPKIAGFGWTQTLRR